MFRVVVVGGGITCVGSVTSRGRVVVVEGVGVVGWCFIIVIVVVVVVIMVF